MLPSCILVRIIRSAKLNLEGKMRSFLMLKQFVYIYIYIYIITTLLQSFNVAAFSGHTG